MKIKFGPSGLGSVKDAIGNLEYYSELGLKACEIAFTYNIYIKNKKDAEEIKNKAKELGISLSIHAPYWINLNSEDSEKIEKSKQRILRCLEVGTWLDVKKVVFHPGYYGKKNKEETFQEIKSNILDIIKRAEKNKYTPELAPETTGKINVFGSIDEIKRLVDETKCSFCIDFAHILAREKNYNFKEVFSKFKQRDMHIHFSGIEYSEKGERKHKTTDIKEWKKLLNNLADRNYTIISESPNPIKDSVAGIKLID